MMTLTFHLFLQVLLHLYKVKLKSHNNQLLFLSNQLMFLNNLLIFLNNHLTLLKNQCMFLSSWLMYLNNLSSWSMDISLCLPSRPQLVRMLIILTLMALGLIFNNLILLVS